MADCWHLKNATSGPPKPTMTTVRACTPLPVAESKTVYKLDRTVDEYTPFVSKGFIHAPGFDNITPITILRDTGANQSILLESRLPRSAQTSTGTSVLIQGVELETMSIPLHKITLNCDIVSGPVTVGVRHSMPVKEIDLILGNDLAGEKVSAVPHMLNNPEKVQCSTADPVVYPACAVIRAMAKQAQVSQEQSNIVRRATLTEDQEETELELADSFMAHDQEGAVDCKELEQDCKELDQNENTQLQGIRNAEPGTIRKEGLIELQEKEADLSYIQEHVVPETQAALTQVGYYKKSGVLMRHWKPQDAPANETWRAVHQIVVPGPYRNEVLHLAHESPLAGHLGINKTHQRVLQHFYWPGLRKDVVKFCNTCHTCQVIGKPNQCKQVAPLVLIPATEEPFNRVIIDCVGPLPKTKAGNQYLLTIMCSSTRFPEAIPMKNIKAPKIVAALVKFFTLVGLPKAIQSDQGSNFMSGLFQQVMYELGIKQYTSSAYHPQSQGALERFHQTLKNMMRSYCYEQGRDWDEGVHLLLFAVREAVQDSLGFSPFELLFGREVRGPLKLLKESWLEEDDQVSLLEQVSQLRHRITRVGEIARANLKVSQRKMKTWYDQRA